MCSTLTATTCPRLTRPSSPRALSRTVRRSSSPAPISATAVRTKQDTFQAHGEPLGADEVRATKRALGWPDDPPFHLPDAALRVFRSSLERGAALEAAWRQRADAYTSRFPAEAGDFTRGMAGELPDEWEAQLPVFTPADGQMATRDAGGKVLAALAAVVPNLIGGSADLDPSTRTAMKDRGDFQAPCGRPTKTARRPREGPAVSGAMPAATSTSVCASTSWQRR